MELKSMAKDEDLDDESKETDNENELVMISRKFRNLWEERSLDLRWKAYLKGEASKEKDNELQSLSLPS